MIFFVMENATGTQHGENGVPVAFSIMRSLDDIIRGNSIHDFCHWEILQNTQRKHGANHHIKNSSNLFFCGVKLIYDI